jgi:hypothetical protein
MSNYRTEMLACEVVNFSKPYHVILGQPCYVKFMAIPSYAYLKLKISGPTGIIIVEAKAQYALNYEHDNLELGSAAVATVELRELSLKATLASLGPAMPPSSDTFKAAEDAKAMEIDAEDPTKTIQIRAGVNPK